MPILRDIAARLGLQLDKGSFVQAERTIGGLTAQLGALSTIVIGSGAAVALGKVITLGSDANETLNVLNASFEENSQAVQDWAGSFAQSAGRSEFELREMAGTIGSVLNPLMERNAEVAAGMSTRLTELAVDLGSFFNATDTDALAALRSGIVGESEPLKRFGIVMNEATLEAFRLEQGIKKSTKQMSIAEKTALRYNYILNQTELAHGDAAKTSEGWANASKALVGALKDLGTRLGLTILPFAEKVVTGARNVIRGFLEWQKGTNFLKAALIVLGAIGAKVALGLLIAWAPVLLPILKFVAIVTVAALVLDDFLTFMQGGDSVIGRFIDAIFGPGSATAAVKALHEAWDGMKLFWNQEVIPAIETLKGAFALFWEDVKLGWETISAAFDKAWNDIKLGLEILGDIFAMFWEDVKAGWETLLKLMPQSFQDAFEKVRERVVSIIEFIKKAFGAIGGAVSKAARFLGIDTGPIGKRGLQPSDMPARGASPNEQTVALQRYAGQGTPASRANTNNVENSVTVNVQGNATARDASRIADAAGEAQRRVNRRTMAALTQRAES